jgi:histidinol dehydrogenase
VIDLIKSTEKERFRSRVKKILDRSVALDTDLLREVSVILDNVRTRGDEALIEYTEKFDGVRLTQDQIRVDREQLQESARGADERVVNSFREAIKRVTAFHEYQREHSWKYQPSPGILLGQRISPVEKAGLYVPGGKASYPSSVVMNVIPARIAEVGRIVVVTPPRTLSSNPLLSALLLELDIEEIYSIGGAQSIAALTFGTQTVPRVDKITGPGNKYVAAAKKLVFGAVGIDSIAGPSEVVIFADEKANPAFIAADMLAQSEHDEEASAILITTSEQLGQKVLIEIKRQTSDLPRAAIVEASLRQYGAVMVVRTIEEGAELVNELSPEHLEVMFEDDTHIRELIHHAGAIFYGEYTPEALGDYIAGPNHVLPTGRSSRFSSALGVYDFIKRTSELRFSAEELMKVADEITLMARSEGLEAHARSVIERFEKRGS